MAGKPRLLPLLFFFLVLGVYAQPPFTQLNVVLPQLAYSASAWGDYDHDGDLDLALSGIEGNNPITKIFRNDNGTFTALASPLLPLHYGSLEWGDFDLDGDLDLLATGSESNGTPHTLVLSNNDGNFIDSGITLPGLVDGQAAWGDLENDGDLDILLAGSAMAKIYRNDGLGNFTDINAPLPAVETPMCCWNDYNNDGRADVMVCGNTGGGIVSKLYRNDNGVFTPVVITPEPFLGLYGGQARWVDLDGDRDQDLVINGMDLYVDGYFLIYRNDGGEQFTKIDNIPASLLSPWLDVADYNADGLPDIILTGSNPGCGGAAVTRLLKNEGGLQFSDVSTLLPGYKLGCVSWGDCNADGYTDLLFTGIDEFDYPQTDLYLNNLGSMQFSQNSPPTPPTALSAESGSGSTVLKWKASTDAQTPSNSLTYNIRIGTQTDSYEVMAPLAFLYSGTRFIAAPGNASSDTSWVITGLAAGDYYFSVQAIDNGFMPGAFSDPFMFTFSPAVGIEDNTNTGFTAFPNPCNDLLHLSVIPPSAEPPLLRIFNGAGSLQLSGPFSGVLDTSAWPAGIYVVECISNETVFKIKILKNR